MVALRNIKTDILEYKKTITVALEKSKPMPHDVKKYKTIYNKKKS